MAHSERILRYLRRRRVPVTVLDIWFGVGMPRIPEPSIRRVLNACCGDTVYAAGAKIQFGRRWTLWAAKRRT